jgi:carbonic anhydrase/acetyltransferase-like protein (isoleucine patch superfamily)
MRVSFIRRQLTHFLLKFLTKKTVLMKKIVLLHLFTGLYICLFAQKTVYIPKDFTTNPFLRNYSMQRSYQTANFVLFWGDVVGTDPANYSNPDLRFNPQSICDTLEKIYTKFITELAFCSDAPTTNLGKYKLIIVMNDTWGTGAGAPSGWAFGGSYDGIIGAMWVHPNATRDGGVISHELGHSLQGMISIQENSTRGGGFTAPIANFFWEGHANFMRAQMYPRFAADDIPRVMATSMFHWSSTRHHYSNFRLLFHMQQLDGINMVNRLWKESIANEHPLITYRRLKGWTQVQLNDFVFDYAKREVTLDYPVNNFGAIIRRTRDQLRNGEPRYLWRQFTILKAINETTGRYIVPNAFAPQDYGYNIIPVYSTCPNQFVRVKFKGHTEVNSTAGWRYGFVAVKADGITARYSPVYSDNEREITFQMNSDETQLFLVVMGAPVTHTSYVVEPGWPKIKRYPYELRFQNAIPEGYQTNFRSAYKTNGRVHANGGGWIRNGATVASTVYVGPKAIVLGNSNISGNVRIDGTAWVENARVTDNVVIDGNALVWGGTYSGNVHITDNAVLNRVTASGTVIAKDDVLTEGQTFGNAVVIGGDAEPANCSTNGVYLQFPHVNNGRADCDGKSATDASNQDVNAAITAFPDAQMALTGISCSDVVLSLDDNKPPKPVKPGERGAPEVTVYPNPVSSTFTVQLNNFNKQDNATLFLFDMHGRELIKRDLKTARSIQLNTSSNIRKGTYLLKVVSGNAEYMKKLVVVD